MAKFVKGDIVVIPFPFSDLSGNKKRPAMVLADLPGEDIILCQITSKANSYLSIHLDRSDLVDGFLPVDSFIKPTRIFTADKKIIIRKAGTANSGVILQVTETLIDLFK